MMSARRQSRSYVNGNPHFFKQFTNDARLHRLSGVDFASGKFPFERQAPGCIPPGGQDEAVSFYYGAGDVDMHQGVDFLLSEFAREQVDR